jgi:hypothetical protein
VGFGQKASDESASCTVVIRAWYDDGRFRARAIMAAGDDPSEGTVAVVDSVDRLCESLREFFAAHASAHARN